MSAWRKGDQHGPIAIVFGTRPEVVKLAGIIRRLGPSASCIDTGQHYDASLKANFLAEMRLPAPDVVFAIGGMSRGSQIGEATRLLDDLWRNHPPTAVIVQGDTNSAVAGALAANACDRPLVHVEAGLRSFDRRMPEEHNRVLIDHLADLCLAPTETSRQNLLAEGIASTRIVVTGNTVVDAVRDLLPNAATRSQLLRRYRLEPKQYVLSTFHRPENVDEPEALLAILRQLAALRLPVVLSLHPRTRNRIGEFGLSDYLDQLCVVDPLGYVEFLGLAAECAVLVSDSGGVQEEATVLKRPVVVVRRATERPEALGSFCQLVSPGPEIGACVLDMIADLDRVHARLAALGSPYGGGDVARRCVEAVERWLSPEAVPRAAV